MHLMHNKETLFLEYFEFLKKLANTNQSEKMKLYKGSLQLRKILLYLLLTIVVYVICVGIGLDFWITDKVKIYRHSLSKISQKSVEGSWFRVKFYTAINSNETGIFRGDNVSAFDSDKTCTVPRFDDSEHPSYVTCKRTKPIKGSCETANKTFHAEPTPTCSHQKTYDICRIVSKGNSHKVNCSNNICSKNISVGTINYGTGAMQWKNQVNLASLEDAIRNIINKKELKDQFGFCFLQCTLKNKTNASQLLLLPKNFSHIVCNEGTSCRDFINVNVIWLDSTSHSHFYRSMPKSIEALRRIKSSQDAYVFSYNLMQSMLGGTFVNTVAFTSGQIYSRNHLIKKRVPIGDLFDMFNRRGHHVTWIDDLCWTWSINKCACGIPTFLGMATNKQKSFVSTWKMLQKLLLGKGVDQVDISLANCEIMNANNITDPFKDTHPICYNGHYQTHYILSYLEMLQQQLNLVRRPFFNFLDLNTGHEATGRRIQTLDGSFAKFVTSLSRQKNTFTLIFGTTVIHMDHFYGRQRNPR
ncbi:uncharacterized protein [Amphiura filiformis]|uniref:uncharacterized protein n=1 Tax=Amphiura filiformis TaxID=82378 RepID=UPI003B2128CB